MHNSPTVLWFVLIHPLSLPPSLNQPTYQFADGNFKAAERNYSTSGTLFIARAPATSGDCGGPSETNYNDRAECGHWTAEARPAPIVATDARTTVAWTRRSPTDASGHAPSEPSSGCTRSSGSSSGGGCSGRRRRTWRPRWPFRTGQPTAGSSDGAEARAASARGDEEQQRHERARPGQTCKLMRRSRWWWSQLLREKVMVVGYGFVITEEFNIARRTGKVPTAVTTGHARTKEGQEGGQGRSRE